MAKNTKSKNDNYDDMKPKKGHKQEDSVEKVAEKDVDDQHDGQDDPNLGDPFDSMMAQASRNARYTVAFIPNQGTVDRGDPTNISPDENENMPKTRSKSPRR